MICFQTDLFSFADRAAAFSWKTGSEETGSETSVLLKEFRTTQEKTTLAQTYLTSNGMNIDLSLFSYLKQIQMW